MNIGLDIDGVLADFVAAFYPLAKALGGDEVTAQYTTATMPQWYPFPGIPFSVERATWEDLWRSETFWLGLDLVASTGDIEALYGFRARNQQSWIYYLTSRKGRGVVDQTNRWLDEHGFPRGSVIVCTHRDDKAKLLKPLNITFVLDDYPGTVRTCNQVVPGSGYMLRRTYNANTGAVAGSQTVESVAEFISRIRG